jgi:hypothetical protein
VWAAGTSAGLSQGKGGGGGGVLLDGRSLGRGRGVVLTGFRYAQGLQGDTAGPGEMGERVM